MAPPYKCPLCVQSKPYTLRGILAHAATKHAVKHKTFIDLFAERLGFTYEEVRKQVYLTVPPQSKAKVEKKSPSFAGAIDMMESLG